MSRRTIRRTLLQRLFESPRPLERDAYALARPALYPSESDFAEFLNTDNEQEMTRHARAILLDLVFTSSCPPPSHLLINLISTQQQDKDTISEGDYIPRDHFVHLVHLYLLGIYLFAYHESLHTRCSADLYRHKRLSTLVAERPKEGSAYTLFGSIWKNFVLYHDLGYPLERLLPEARDSAKGREWLKPFTRIAKSIHKDLSFKAIARLIATKTLLAQEHHATFEEMFIKQHSLLTVSDNSGAVEVRLADDASQEMTARALKDAALLERWRPAVFLPNVTGPQDLQTIFTAVPELEICALLEAPSGASDVALFGPLTDPTYFAGPKVDLAVPVRRYLSGTSAATAWIIAPPTGYRWHYFAINPSRNYDASLKELISDQLEDFYTLAKAVESSEPYRALKTKGVDNAVRLSAVAYLSIVEIRGYLPREDDEGVFEQLEEMFASVARGREKILRDIPEFLATAVKEVAAEVLRTKGNALLKLLEEAGSETAAAMIASPIWEPKNRNRVVAQLAQTVDKRIGEPLRVASAAKKCTNGFRASLNGAVQKGRDTAMDPLRETTIDRSFNLAQVLRGRATFSGSVDDLLGRRGFGRFAELAGSYVPKWIQDNHRDYPQKELFIDHGFASAIVALTAGWEYDACLDVISRDPSTPEARRLRLALGMWSGEASDRVQVETRLLKSLVAETVLLHNIYPADLKRVPVPGKTSKRSVKNVKTQLSLEPFIFLALLADGLQKWDRACLLNQATSSRVGVTPGSRYNLEVGKDQLLHVWLVGGRLDMRAAEQELRTSLHSYLEDADSLIKLTLEEG